MSQADITKTLKIKTNTVKRLHKELAYYHKERDKEQARVEQMRGSGADEHDIRQAENVLAESAMMVPQTRQRLETALTELQAFMGENAQDAGDGSELAEAQEALALVEEQLTKS